MLICTGDHDMPRISDFRNEDDLFCVFTFLLTMPGVPLIYYGDEIGMRGIPGLVSKEGGYTRTQCRTPMQWDSSVNAGFSTAPADKLYLPVDSAVDAPNVAEQQKREQSLWRKVRKLIHWRKRLPALQADSKFELVLADYPMIYIREKDDQKVLVIIQPANRPWKCRVPLKDIKGMTPLIGSWIRVKYLDDGLEFSGNGAEAGVFLLLPTLKNR